MTKNLDLSDAFRSKARQGPVIILLIITTITSILATILFILHLYHAIPTLFMGIYAGVLGLLTLITFGLPAKLSGLSSITGLRSIIDGLEIKYKIIVATYVWLSIGGLIFYPIAHVYTTLNAAPSHWSGVIGGVIALSLGLQAIIINYLFNGSTSFSKRDLELIREQMDPDDFDFDDYSDEELSSIPDDVLDDIDDSESEMEWESLESDEDK